MHACCTSAANPTSFRRTHQVGWQVPRHCSNPNSPNRHTHPSPPPRPTSPPLPQGLETLGGRIRPGLPFDLGSRAANEAFGGMTKAVQERAGAAQHMPEELYSAGEQRLHRPCLWLRCLQGRWQRACPARPCPHHALGVWRRGAPGPVRWGLEPAACMPRQGCSCIVRPCKSPIGVGRCRRGCGDSTPACGPCNRQAGHLFLQVSAAFASLQQRIGCPAALQPCRLRCEGGALVMGRTAVWCVRQAGHAALKSFLPWLIPRCPAADCAAPACRVGPTTRPPFLGTTLTFWELEQGEQSGWCKAARPSMLCCCAWALVSRNWQQGSLGAGIRGLFA